MTELDQRFGSACGCPRPPVRPLPPIPLELREASVAYVERARASPRLSRLFRGFGRIASGADQVPVHGDARPRYELMGDDAETREFAAAYMRLAGHFSRHYIASVPYVLEEECRLGAAIVRFAGRSSGLLRRNACVYTLGSADATLARTIGAVSHGSVRTLSCSPNPENRDEFLARGGAASSRFFLGPFFDCVAALRSGAPGYEEFFDGFDLIVEDTTFQMYGRERREPIALVAPLLRDDGVMVFIEKFAQDDEREYRRRELQKDAVYKGRYFTDAQIRHKQSWVLEIMRRQQITIAAMAEEVAAVFRHAAVLWSSGNFATIAAAWRLDALVEFTRALIPPCIPAEFAYERVPRALHGCAGVQLAFREPTS